MPIIFFSDGGKSLACIDDSTDHVLTVWDWEKADGAEKLYETKTTKEFHQIITVESVKVYIMNIIEWRFPGYLNDFNIDHINFKATPFTWATFYVGLFTHHKGVL